MPCPVGCYLGSRRVLNVGTGFLYYGDGLYVRQQAAPRHCLSDVAYRPEATMQLPVTL